MLPPAQYLNNIPPVELIRNPAENPTPFINKHLLQLKKTASHLITLTGFIAKTAIPVYILFLNQVFMKELLAPHKEEKNILNLVEDMILVESLLLIYLFILVLGGEKAGLWIEDSMQGSSQLAIKAAKGTIYIFTLALMGLGGKYVADGKISRVYVPGYEPINDPNLLFAKAIVYCPAFILSNLGVVLFIDNVCNIENTLQAALNKLY